MKSLNQFITTPLLFLLVLIAGSSCKKDYFCNDGPWDAENISNDSLSFIVIGDWGREGGGSQISVADQVHLFSKKFNAQFIISTGDNFYTTGVSSTSDAQWFTSFENVYNKEGHQVPWYPVLGNHDYQSNPQAQIEYSSNSNRWRMPARYYSFNKTITDSCSALFVFTDTSPFVGEYASKDMADLKQQDTSAQFNWMQQKLSASSDKWKIVIGHHPVYSVGSHGNTNELIRRFVPLFNQTGTDFYLAGHDHSLQHIYYPENKVRYLVSGGGATGTRVTPNANSLYARATPGFLVMTLYSKRANFYFYNQRGELQHRTQLVK